MFWHGVDAIFVAASVSWERLTSIFDQEDRNGPVSCFLCPLPALCCEQTWEIARSVESNQADPCPFPCPRLDGGIGGGIPTVFSRVAVKFWSLYGEEIGLRQLVLFDKRTIFRANVGMGRGTRRPFWTAFFLTWWWMVFCLLKIEYIFQKHRMTQGKGSSLMRRVHILPLVSTSALNHEEFNNWL